MSPISPRWLLAAFAFGALVFVFTYPYFSGERQKEARYRDVAEARATRVAAQGAGEIAASRRKAVADTLKELEQRQKAAEKISLRLRLQRAGLNITPKVYWLASAACGLAFAFIVDLSLPPSARAPVRGGHSGARRHVRVRRAGSSPS